jgi:hypothetical protein
LDDDLSYTEQDDRDWKERKEQVNVQLLREAILEKGSTNPRAATGTVPRYDDGIGKDGINPTQTDRATNDPNASNMAPDPVKSQQPEKDMEDISWSRVPGERLLGLKEGEMVAKGSENMPAVEYFYRRLDQLLEQNRQKSIANKTQRETTIHNSSAGGGQDKAPAPWKARVRKLQEHGRGSRDQGNFISSTSDPLWRKYQGLIVAGLVIGFFFFLVTSCFALYGIYALATGQSLSVHSIPKQSATPSFASQEVVIRLVREIVHVTDGGDLIGEPQQVPLSPEEMEKFGQTIAKMFQ